MFVFEVVDFSGPYHVILEWSCYVKFMAIASYTYLKFKILGPAGVITVEARMQRVLDCKQDNIELVATMVTMAELRELSLQVPAALLSSAMPSTSSIFKMDEDDKAVHICTGDLAKTMQIGASLDPKLESELVDFL
jgi:hypothetical protein